MTMKDYDIRTYAGGPYCNHITYSVKNMEGLPLHVGYKDSMSSYTAAGTYPWHVMSLHICIEQVLYADIYDEEHEALKKYKIIPLT